MTRAEGPRHGNERDSAGQEISDDFMPTDPPESRFYRNRAEALSRDEHFQLGPGAVGDLTPAELAELGLPNRPLTDKEMIERGWERRPEEQPAQHQPPGDHPEFDPKAAPPEQQPFWQASGLADGREAVIRWEAGRWQYKGARPEVILGRFLLEMSVAGFGSDAAMSTGPDPGPFVAAAEAAAWMVLLGGPIVFDSNFGSGAWEPGRVY